MMKSVWRIELLCVNQNDEECVEDCSGQRVQHNRMIFALVQGHGVSDCGCASKETQFSGEKSMQMEHIRKMV